MFAKNIEELRKFNDSAITIADENGMIQYVDTTYENISGYKLDEIVGHSFGIVRDKDTPGYFYKQMWHAISQNKEWEGIVKNKDKNGNRFVIKLRIIPFIHADGNKYLMGESKLMTNCVNEMEKFYHYQFDKLTGIHNREIMIDDIEHRNEEFFQIALFDIDNFKGVNDFYGYQNGDLLIRKLSEIIVNHLDISNSVLYHISIDEFALVSFTDGNNHDKVEFKTFCKNIIESIDHTPIKLNDKIELNISVSCGLTMNDDVWQGLKEADMALHHSKTSSKQIVDFTKEIGLHKKLELKMHWLAELKIAIAKGNVVPWLQPIFDNRSNKIVKFEALMRVIDSNESIITPYHFLDISKPTKVYEKISSLMIMKTLEYFATNHDHFNVNVSWEDIRFKSTVNLIKHYLDEYENLGNRMTIELVESESVENYDIFHEFIDSMKNYGVKIALDDFGSGYSNFVYLDKIKADYVKIDGTLIQDMMKNENTLFIVEAIVSIAKKFDIETVAEFVSDEATFNKVKELGIDYSQGYFIGKPRPINW